MILNSMSYIEKRASNLWAFKKNKRILAEIVLPLSLQMNTQTTG